ncbi:MAG: hypothetical protein E5X96_00165 [Mesorhizobium sp.]|nr:MAG: hypothetical protein E5X96_00165 [Mesorhizobium sp.]
MGCRRGVEGRGGGRAPPSERRGLVAGAYEAAVRAGISDDQFWRSSYHALRQRIEILVEQEVQRNWTIAWCHAVLNARAWHDPKKLPKSPNELWSKPVDPALALAAALGRPGGIKE